MRRTINLMSLLFILVANSQQIPEHRIGILLDQYSPESQPLLEGLKLQISTVIGEDATILFPEQNLLFNEGNVQKAKDNYNLLVDEDTDIILAFGAINTLMLSELEEHLKPTILFGEFSKEFFGLEDTKTSTGIRNLNFLVESGSFEDDILKFRELTGFKKLGVLLDADIAKIPKIRQTFDSKLQKIDIGYQLIPFNSVEDIIGNLGSVDAVYLAGGFFLTDKQIKTLANQFINQGVPCFTATSVQDVKNGLFATQQSDDGLEQFYRRIALIVEAHLMGEALSEMPISIDFSNRLTINYNTAHTLDIPIKNSLVRSTDFVGELKNANPIQSYNLIELLRAVTEKNLTLQSAEKNIDLSNQDVRTSKSAYLPGLTANTSGTYVDPKLAEISNGGNPEFSTSGNITLQQTLFSESANANIIIQKSLLNAQIENFSVQELNTILEASNAYFNTLILKANTQITLQNLNLTKKNLQIAQQNFSAGQSGKSDLLRFRSEMAQNTQSLVETSNQLDQSFIVLNQLLNNPINLEIDIEDVELNEGIFKQYDYSGFAGFLDDPSAREIFIDFLVEEAKQNAPELKSLDFNLKAVERDIKLNSSGRFLPTISLQGQYNRTFGRNGKGSTAPQGFELVDDNYNVGVNVSIPLLNQNRTNINKQRAFIQKLQIEINKENSQLAISANVRNGVLNLVNEISNLELSKVSEEAAREAFELTQASYSNGAVSIIQLLDAQNNYLNARLGRTNAVYNYLISSLQLERFIGYYFLLRTEEENDAFSQRFLEFANTRN